MISHLCTSGHAGTEVAAGEAVNSLHHLARFAQRLELAEQGQRHSLWWPQANRSAAARSAITLEVPAGLYILCLEGKHNYSVDSINNGYVNLDRIGLAAAHLQGRPWRGRGEPASAVQAVQMRALRAAAKEMALSFHVALLCSPNPIMICKL